MYALWLCVHSEREKEGGKKPGKRESPMVIVMGVSEAYDCLIATLLCLDFSQWRSYRHCLCDFCIAVGTAIAWCCGCCTMPKGHCLNILLFWQWSTAALVVWVGTCFEVSVFCPPFPLVPIPNRPSGLHGC